MIIYYKILVGPRVEVTNASDGENGICAAVLLPRNTGAATAPLFKGDKGARAYVALALRCTVLLHPIPAGHRQASLMNLSHHDDLATALGCLSGGAIAAGAPPASNDLPVRRVDLARAVQSRVSAATEDGTFSFLFMLWYD